MLPASAQVSDAAVNAASPAVNARRQAQPVSGRSGAEHHGGQGQGVPVGDPLQAARPGVQITRQIRQCDVDHRDAQHQHRRGQADHGKRRAPGGW